MEITLRAGEAQSFQCPRYGFKLHIPKQALPDKLSDCTILIRVNPSCQYKFPENADLVSAIYQISCPVELTKPVIMEIQHCAIIERPEQSSFLAFVRAEDSCSQLPYQFKPINRGNFVVNSRYAAISLEKFSVYAIVRTVLSYLLPWQYPSTEEEEEDSPKSPNSLKLDPSTEEDSPNSPNSPKLDYHCVLYLTPVKPSISWKVICIVIKHINAILTVSIGIIDFTLPLYFLFYLGCREALHI